MFREFMIHDIARIIGGEIRDRDLELVRDVSIHSQTTMPGHLFFALKGEHTDGHAYVKDAFAHGAVAAVVQQYTNSGPEILVSDTLFALGSLAQEYRSLFHPKTIGITGTNGKTTVKNLVSAILKKKYQILHTEKNYNSLIGLPLTLLKLSGDEDFLVVEMGTNSPGEIERLCEIARPSIGVITNIGPGHLEGLNSIEGILKEKLSLVSCLPDDGFALLGDGVGEVGRKNILRFSLDMLEAIQLSETGSCFIYQGDTFSTPLLGIANVYNCLAALCLTSQLGVRPEEQGEAIAEVHAEPGRLEPLHHNGLFIINDTYNANPVSMRNSIDFVATLKRDKIFILGDMRELGVQSKALHQGIGEYAKKYCDMLLTCGDEARLYGGLHFRTKDTLVRYIIDNLNGEEAVLVKASRTLQFEEIVNEIVRRY
jgi:UDP-N-acetylmuramoyl-tripeptide--D-alanyl-D-alanine ligase